MNMHAGGWRALSSFVTTSTCGFIAWVYFFVLNRTEIVNAFGRHTKREDLDDSRDLLLDLGVIQVRPEETGGHPREVWTLR